MHLNLYLGGLKALIGQLGKKLYKKLAQGAPLLNNNNNNNTIKIKCKNTLVVKYLYNKNTHKTHSQ
jgi:hypothetical protein